MSLTDGVRQKRPRDRREQIIASAGRQFWERNYDQVGIVEIAAGVGIGSSALYRHFAGKGDVLVAVLHQSLDELERSLPAEPDLEAVLDAWASHTVRRREFGALWERLAGRIPPADQLAIEQRLEAALDRAGAAVVVEDAALATDLTLRVRAAHAVLNSPSHHHAAMDRTQFRAVLSRAARAVITSALPSSSPAVTDPRPAVLTPLSRREALFGAAVRLFGERGYAAVSLGDIGAAAGISGPSIYHHFSRKADLLTGILDRGNSALWLDLSQALAAAEDASDGLDQILESYVLLSERHPEVIAVMGLSLDHLPAPDRGHYRRLQAEYVAEWVALLAGARPELSDAHARVLIHAALALPNALSQVERFRTGPDYAAQTTAFGRAVLTS